MSSHSCVHSQLIRYASQSNCLQKKKKQQQAAVFGFQFSLFFACGALRSLLIFHRFFHFLYKFIVVTDLIHLLFCLQTLADFPIRRHSRCQSPAHWYCIFMRKYSPLHCLLADCIVIVVFIGIFYFTYSHCYCSLLFFGGHLLFCWSLKLH